MTRTIHAFAILVAIAFAAGSSAEAAQIYLDPLYGVQVTKNVPYGIGATKNGNVILYCDIYQPVDIGLAPVLDNRPAVIIQDGGAWASATKERGRVKDPAMYNAARGFTAIVTDYRQGAPTGGDNLVSAVNGLTKFGTQPYNGVSIPSLYQIFPGTAAIRAGIEDFAVAIDFFRTNAATYNIDPNRIGIAGGSAGGIDALLLQYANNNPVPLNPAYAAQAVVGLVSSTYGNYGKIKPGGPPVFLLNNTSDPVVPWESQMPTAFKNAGIYTEQWFQKTQLNHDVDWDEILVGPDGGKTVRQRVNEFLAYQLAGGPITYVVPEPSSVMLAVIALAVFGAIPVRRRWTARRGSRT